MCFSVSLLRNAIRSTSVETSPTVMGSKMSALYVVMGGTLRSVTLQVSFVPTQSA